MNSSRSDSDPEAFSSEFREGTFFASLSLAVERRPMKGHGDRLIIVSTPVTFISPWWRLEEHGVSWCPRD